ncbi:Rieske (2Fe-2S) protein [Kineosporia sp. J2-2]|uniref:Cytochrome bc1 complex Rieske iron-sulfur subunit n=1 Tax=Kineosporia corallincola TaxID=2835133 RepID=A0ABS5TDT0_9ACTN|nr:Rieske (2Fe-2S) protein [Kineosporia corallincola]MBT0769250.1 Rieske (2Fe-2S) protein [Kineosporia corallincola]
MTATLRSTGETQTASATTPTPEGGGFSRRRAIAVCSFSLLGAAGLAACGGGSDDDTASGTSSSSSSDTGTGTDATTGSSSEGGQVIAKVSDIAEGDAASYTLDGDPLIVAMPEADEPVAFSAVCPHQGATVQVQGDELVCPLHQSKFEKLTGKFISGPANASLTEVQVEVSDGNIVTA